MRAQKAGALMSLQPPFGLSVRGDVRTTVTITRNIYPGLGFRSGCLKIVAASFDQDKPSTKSKCYA